MRHRLLAVPVGISLAAAAITGTAGAAAARVHHTAGVSGNPPGAMSSAPSATFDSRASAAPLHAGNAQRTAAQDLLRSAGSGARIIYDPLFATPRALVHDGGYLTGPARGGAVAIARAWINTHRAALALSSAGA